MGAQPESGVRAFVDRLLGAEQEADIATILAEARACQSRTRFPPQLARTLLSGL